MDRVRQVRARDRIPRCFVRMLTPISVSQDDDVLAVRTNHWDQLLVERFDNSRPRHSQRFVVSLEQNIRVIAIFPSHLVKESLGFVDMPLGVMIVPIDDDVDALRDGRVDDQLNLRLLSPWILQVTRTLVNAQHSTNQRAFPVINQPIDYSRCIILSLPLRPEEGHALQLYSIAIFTDDIVSCNTQPTVLLHRATRRGRWRGSWRGWVAPAGPPATCRGRASWVEGAGASGTIGSRLVAPPSAIFAAIPTICLEPAATTAHWRGVWRRGRRRCGGRGGRNWLRRWDCPADTAAQSTSLQHIAGVCITFSTGGPTCATRIVIGARADTATQSTVLRHP